MITEKEMTDTLNRLQDVTERLEVLAVQTEEAVAAMIVMTEGCQDEVDMDDTQEAVADIRGSVLKGVYVSE